MHVLFVCTGNICRSPTAERLVRAYEDEHHAGITAESAGTRAVVGHGVHDKSAQVLLSLGGSPDGFAARRLTPAIAMDADVVLTMTQRHRDDVLTVAPRTMRRTFTLLGAAAAVTETGSGDPSEWFAARATAADIDDPIGGSDDDFIRIGDQIAEALGTVLRVWT